MVFKKILAYISAVVLCCEVAETIQIADTLTFIVASAEYEEYQHGGSCGENATYLIDENTKTLTISGTGDMDYTNPSNYSYGWDNYNDIYFIKTVVIEDGITSISDNAFLGCTSLASVTIPDSVTSIGESAFNNCTSLESVTIPDSVTFIGEKAFQSCESLTNATIGNGITSIGYRAFGNCKSLTEINIPDSVTSIGYEAFNNCTSLESVTIPDSVISIGENVFYDCTSLTSVTIPDSVTSIGENVFYGCALLTSVTIPDSVTSIGENAFYGCTSLTSVTVPDSVTKIGYSAFGYQDYYTCYIGGEEWLINTVRNFMVYGAKGSEAEKYATENGFKFIEIKDTSSEINGDVDGDGKITSADALNVLQAVTNIIDLTDEQKKRADLDGDGEITSTDALYILQMIVSLR